MAWKHLTQADVNYYVNLDEVAYVQEIPGGSMIVFSAISDNRRVSLSVEQRPHQILGGEEVS